MDQSTHERQTKLRSNVIKLIKQKLEPLNMKYYRFKYGISQIMEKPPLQTSVHSQLSQKDLERKKQKRARRALVKIPTHFTLEDYNKIQKKVERYIQIQKIEVLEKNYVEAEQLGLKKVEQKTQKESPLKKYLELFKNAELPSEKYKYVEDQNLSEMLKKIETAKNVKEAEVMQENVRDLWNNFKSKKNKKGKQNKVYELPSKISKRDENKLNRRIMREIKTEYQNQKSSKIRININHKKMINMK